MSSNESYILVLVLRHLPISYIVSLFFVSKRVNEEITLMFDPVVRYNLKSEKVYREYVPIGYPITERKKKYLENIIINNDFSHDLFKRNVRQIYTKLIKIQFQLF